MNVENFTAWIQALRSGEYKQGKDTLYVPDIYSDDHEGIYDAYCCLGVGCEVADLDKMQINWRTEALAPREFITWLDLPVLVSNEEGRYVPEEDGLVADEEWSYDIAVDPNRSGYVSAANMNDKGRSFKVIATWLEKNRDRLVAFPG